MYLKLIVTTIFLSASQWLFAQSADTTQHNFTLQQCIELALQNNAEVQHSEVASQRQNANLQGAKGYLLPTLYGDVIHGINNGKSIDPFTNTYSNQTLTIANYSLNTSLTLFNEFALQNNIKQNRLAYNATQMEVQQNKDAIALNVILEYLQVLTNEDLVSASAQQADVAAKQVERLNILNDEGAVSPSQLYDLKGVYADNELNVVNAKSNLETAKIALAQLMNILYDKNLMLQRINLSETLENQTNSEDSVYQAALQNLAIVKATEYRKQSAVYNVKTYRAYNYPSLYLSGGVNTNFSNNATTQQYINTTDVSTNNYVLLNGDKAPVIESLDNYASNKINYGTQLKNNYYTQISIGIRIPLLNNLQNKTLIRNALLLQKDAEITLNSTKTQLQQNIGQANVNLNAAKGRFDALTEEADAYKESFREAEVKFNSGVINSVDYLVTKNNLDRANINLIIARYDYVLRMMVLNYYSGKLTFK